MQSSLSPYSRQSLGELMDDALALVARVNEKLRPQARIKRAPRKQAREILDDRRCLVLAGLLDASLV